MQLVGVVPTLRRDRRTQPAEAARLLIRELLKAPRSTIGLMRE
jgi:hypothetical protein